MNRRRSFSSRQNQTIQQIDLIHDNTFTLTLEVNQTIYQLIYPIRDDTPYPNNQYPMQGSIKYQLIGLHPSLCSIPLGPTILFDNSISFPRARPSDNSRLSIQHSTTYSASSDNSRTINGLQPSEEQQLDFLTDVSDVEHYQPSSQPQSKRPG